MSEEYYFRDSWDKDIINKFHDEKFLQNFRARHVIDWKDKNNYLNPYFTYRQGVVNENNRICKKIISLLCSNNIGKISKKNRNKLIDAISFICWEDEPIYFGGSDDENTE